MQNDSVIRILQDQMRQRALEHAVRTHGDNSCADKVVEVATTYYNFLCGKPSAKQTKRPKKRRS